MNHKERFINALLLKEVDKLPHGEQMIHDMLVALIVDKHLPGDDGNALSKWMFDPITEENFKRHLNARKFLGFDWVQVFPREPVTDIGTDKEGHRLVRDVWGGEQIETPHSSTIIKNPINSPEQMKSYKFPEIDSFDYSNIETWLKKSDLCVAVQIDTGYFKVSQLTGFEEYCVYLYANKSELHCMMEKFTDFQIRLADRLIDLGIDVIWLSDDHAFNSGPFIDPQLLLEFDFKYMKRIVDHIHGRGVPVVLHSCGNLNKTIEMIIDTGVNGLHAVQPSAGNDLYAYKKLYGKKLCFLGNLDINELLPHGSPYEVSMKVKEMVENMFYDRTGFILSTCNLLNEDTPVENAIAMHLSAEKFGR